MRWLPICCVATCVFLTAALAARDQTPAAPMTPGRLAIALLTPGPELNAKLAAALASDQAGLRIVAARAIGVMGLNEAVLSKALQDALGREQNDAVAEAGRRRIRERLAAVTAGLARDLIEKDVRPADESRLIDQFMNKLEAETRP